MSRLIDADALMEYLDKRKTYELMDGRNKAYGKGIRDAMKDIDNAPTIEAEPVRHGHWIENFGTYKCSECGEISCCRGNYCPDCGARLDEVSE